MGKGREWRESETQQLCRSWLAISENAVRGTGQKKSAFSKCLYEHWLANKDESDVDERTEIAIGQRWKKLQPEITKFAGIYSKLKNKERAGWNEEMYVDAALKIYSEQSKQSFEFLYAWKYLRDKPKWTKKLTSASSGDKRASSSTIERPEGRKTAKKAEQETRKGAKQAPSGVTMQVQLRMVAAYEKKALLMEEQIHFNLFMQDPYSEESQEFFRLKKTEFSAKNVRARMVWPFANPRRHQMKVHHFTFIPITRKNIPATTESKEC